MDSENSNIEAQNSEQKYAEQLKASAQRSGSAKLYCYNWMNGLEVDLDKYNVVEVRFKNTRKDYFINETDITLEIGDIVAVEATPGHDIGIVSLTGELVKKQIKKAFGKKIPATFGKVYRKAKESDIEKWQEAKALEHQTMIRARQIAKDLRLNMKIGDVEYQGDKTKAIFYYIADERVDFRELIKLFADEFKIRIEMRQIGVRQEAGRIGGIGLCGRDLCCSSFITNFNSVSTNAARLQEVSLNPQKMAGQCGKLKCCLNFELACYQDARKNFPETNTPLEFQEGKAYHAKTDVYRGIFTYQYKKDDVPVFVELPVERVHEIIELNKKGIKPETLEGDIEEETTQLPDYENVVGQESLTRFDKKKKKKKKNPNQQQQSVIQQNEVQKTESSQDSQPNLNQQAKTSDSAQQNHKPNGGNMNRNKHKHHHNNRPNNNGQNQQHTPTNEA